jgi:hypothetical protein
MKNGVTLLLVDEKGVTLLLVDEKLCDPILNG